MDRFDVEVKTFIVLSEFFIIFIVNKKIESNTFRKYTINIFTTHSLEVSKNDKTEWTPQRHNLVLTLIVISQSTELRFYASEVKVVKGKTVTFSYRLDHRDQIHYKSVS